MMGRGASQPECHHVLDWRGGATSRLGVRVEAGNRAHQGWGMHCQSVGLHQQCALASSLIRKRLRTIFGRTTKVMAKRMLEFYRVL